VFRCDERANVRRLVKPATHGLLGALEDALGELVVHGFFNDDDIVRQTSFAAAREPRRDGLSGGEVEVS